MSTQSHTRSSLSPSLNCAYAMLVASALTLEGVFQNRSPTSAYFEEAQFKFGVAKPGSRQQYGACSRF